MSTGLRINKKSLSSVIEIQQARVSARGTPVSSRHKEAKRDTAANFGRRVEILDPEDPTLFPEFPPTRPTSYSSGMRSSKTGRNVQLAN